MTMRHIADILDGMALCRGMDGDLAGTSDLSGNKRAAGSYRSAAPRVPCVEEGEPQGVRLVWSNPHMVKRTGGSARLTICV
jgi:hypothetical protein